MLALERTSLPSPLRGGGVRNEECNMTYYYCPTCEAITEHKAVTNGFTCSRCGNLTRVKFKPIYDEVFYKGLDELDKYDKENPIE